MKSINCRNCGKEHTPSKASIGYYCSNLCQQTYQSAQLVREWLEGKASMYGASLNIRPAIRNFLIKEAGYACQGCGWNKVNPKSGNCPLEVDHTDGRWQNEARGNLRVLCPNCHSLTPTHKALNKGNGREARRKASELQTDI